MIYKVKIGLTYDHKGEVLREGATVEVDGPGLTPYQIARLCLPSDYQNSEIVPTPQAAEITEENQEA